MLKDGAGRDGGRKGRGKGWPPLSAPPPFPPPTSTRRVYTFAPCSAMPPRPPLRVPTFSPPIHARAQRFTQLHTSSSRTFTPPPPPPPPPPPIRPRSVTHHYYLPLAELPPNQQPCARTPPGSFHPLARCSVLARARCACGRVLCDVFLSVCVWVGGEVEGEGEDNEVEWVDPSGRLAIPATRNRTREHLMAASSTVRCSAN